MKYPDGAVTDAENCLLCHLEDAPDSAVVFRDDLWACEVTPGFEVPGWFVLRVRRHALGWAELADVEVTEYGQRVKDVVTSVAEVFQAPATYVMSFGESYPHYHCLIAARGEDVAPERRVSNIMTLRQDRLDRDRSLEFVPAVRAAYVARTTPKSGAHA